jgi:hypothetical protein
VIRSQLAATKVFRSRGYVRWIGRFAALAGFLLAAAPGCTKPATLPTLNRVHGKVVFEGGRPLSGGSVRFQPLNEPAVTTSGTIGPDGTFVLESYKAGIRSAGATAGPHRVIVDFGSASTPGYEFPTPFEVKPGDNEFTLTVPKPAR